jgi:hypothetical protein
MLRTLTPSAILVYALLAPRAAAAELLPPDRSIEQAVDHYIAARLKEAKVVPAAPADPAELLRRLTLDLNGRIPTPGELADYLADTAPDKKVRLVERLLASPSFVRHQTLELATMLQPDGGEQRRGKQPSKLRDYLQSAVAENRPWDRVFRELITPDEADPKQKGASDFLRGRLKDLDKLTIEVSTSFFGVNVSCAQCHDHPHVHDWKQDNFYGMKSFFARTFENGNYIAERDFGSVKFLPNKSKEKLAPVMFLNGKVIDGVAVQEPPAAEKRKHQQALDAAKKANKAPPLPSVSLRAKLVEVALEPGQRDYFARNIVNRLWHRLYGRGLVMPLDQMHAANPPSHPDLLQWLARDLIEHRYDLRRLVRGLVLSEAYARDSRSTSEDAPDEKLHAVALVRALTPMQMAVALRLATVDLSAVENPQAREKRVDSLERDAARLAGLFAQPGDNFQVGVGEAMLFTNNEGLLNELLVDSPASLVGRLKQVTDLEKRADLAVRSVLSRPGRAEEIKALAEYMRGRAERPVDACRQVVWALLTSAEFRFNH